MKERSLQRKGVSVQFSTRRNFTDGYGGEKKKNRIKSANGRNSDFMLSPKSLQKETRQNNLVQIFLRVL